MMKYQPKLNEKNAHPPYIGLFQKKPKQGGWGYGISRTVVSKIMWNFQGIKKKLIWSFQRSWYLESWSFQVRCNKVLCNFQGWSFDLPGISRGKVKKWKIPGVFWKSMSSTAPPLCFFFFFFRNSSFHLKFWSYFLYLITCKMQPLDVSFLVVLC